MQYALMIAIPLLLQLRQLRRDDLLKVEKLDFTKRVDK